MNQPMWTDILSAVATAVGAAVAFLALRVAIRYTNETTRMRVAAEDQANAAQTQLTIAQKTLQRAIREQRQASQPFLIWTGGGGQNGGSFYRNFVNRGGPVSRCYVNCPGATDTHVANGEFIGSGETGTLQLQFPSIPRSFSFEFCYTTASGEIASQKFDVHMQQNGDADIRLTRGAEAIG